MNDIRITIVIVNWNKGEYVKRLLDQILAIDYFPYQVVIVDNASSDNSIQVIDEHPLPVHLLQNDENMGGSGGFFDGVKYALNNLTQDYIWLLDNDAQIEIDTLLELVNAMETTPDAGIVGSKMMSPRMPEIVTERGGKVDWNLFTWLPCYRDKKNRKTLDERVLNVTYVAACSMLVKRNVFEEIGFFDRDFFLHWDDIEFCLRAREKGYGVYCADRSTIYHGHSASFNPLLLYYDIRNGLFTYERFLRQNKNYFALFNILTKIYKILIYFLTQNKIRYASIVKKTLFDYLANRGGELRGINKYPDYYNCKEYSWKSLPRNPYFAIFVSGNTTKLKGLLQSLKRKGLENYDIYLDKNYDNRIEFDNYRKFYYDYLKAGTIEAVRFSFHLLKRRYDFCICPEEFHNPFNFFFKKVFFYSIIDDKIFRSNIDITKICLVYFTVVAAVSFSIASYPLVMTKALLRKKKASVR